MLTVDLGNSRIKAFAWRTAAASEPQASFEGAADGELFEAWLAGVEPGPAALASVASREQTRSVRAHLERTCGRVLTGPPEALQNRCRQPERVGEDRLYAALGAAEVVGGPCLVVDAGTALTVDALAFEGSAPVFLGGAIAPGPELGAAALASGTAQLPLVRPVPGAPALGRATEEAMCAGLVVGFRGAAERLVEEIAAAAGLGAAPVVLTGGGRAFLEQPRMFTRRTLRVVPELVHRGLLAALRPLAGTTSRS